MVFTESIGLVGFLGAGFGRITVAVYVLGLSTIALDFAGPSVMYYYYLESVTEGVEGTAGTGNEVLLLANAGVIAFGLLAAV